ncbi:MAG: two-component sensor histidine kinase [Deltaproteobacteria bacterium]|nr:two-component sensor histidine kinase [Deltaproteobacteria bacterium]
MTIIIFCVSPLLILGIVLYMHFSNQYEMRMMETLRTLAENRRGALNLFFDERIAQLVTLGYTNTLEQMSNEEFLGKAFDVMQRRSRSFIDLGVIDQEGNHLAYVGPYREILKGVNYKHEEWFYAVKNTGEYVSDIFLGFRKMPHFIIAILVRGKTENWVLRATINSDVLQDIVDAAQIGKTGDAFIINRDNILQTKPRFRGEVMEPAPGPDFSKTMTFTEELLPSNGEKRLYAAVPLKSKQWVLVIGEDPKEVLAPLLRAKYIVGFLVLAGIFVISSVAVYTTRHLMQQLIISDQKKAAADELLMQSSKMAALGKMAAGIAHEINNPLAVIAEKAGWLKDLLAEEDMAHSPNLQEFQDTLNRIEYHVDRAKKVTHRLLGFARRMEPVIENVDINKVLDESVGFLENEARFLNINIQKDLDANLPIIKSDTTQLQQVFLNILNNAIDAIGRNGEINIKTKYLPRNNLVAIEIADNGPGIPKEVLSKIFDPFFTTKEVGQGTGLGLSISYGIIEKLGGNIKVASEPDQGTTFTIILPVSEPGTRAHHLAGY